MRNIHQLWISIFAAASVHGSAVQPAFAQIPLTSDDVASRVRSTSATLAARRADVEAAEAAVGEARVALWPRLTASGFYARYSPISGPTLGNIVMTPNPGPTGADNPATSVPLRFSVLRNAAGVQVGLSVPASDYLFRFPHTIAASKLSLTAAQEQGYASEKQATQSARNLYYSWARAVLQKEVADAAVEQTRAHLDFARSRQGAGSGLSTEAVRYESELANAELLQRKLSHLAELLADQLRTAMHDSRPSAYVVGETFDQPGNDSALVDFENCYRIALAQRSELTALVASADSETEQAKAATSSMFPRLELYGLGLGSNPNPRYVPAEDRFHVTWEIGGKLSYSPNEWAAARTQARQHRARAQSLVAQRQQLAESVRMEVLSAVQAQQDCVLALVAAQKSLTLAQELLRVRRSLYTEGRAAHVELTDAETEIVRARFAEVDAKIDTQLASIRLRGAMGTLDP